MMPVRGNEMRHKMMITAKMNISPRASIEKLVPRVS